jgi:hypothetical protein
MLNENVISKVCDSVCLTKEKIVTLRGMLEKQTSIPNDLRENLQIICENAPSFERLIKDSVCRLKLIIGQKKQVFGVTLPISFVEIR